MINPLMQYIRRIGKSRNIKPSRLLPDQSKLWDTEDNIVVAVCPRRWGKDTFARYKAMSYKHSLIVYPTAKQRDINMDILLKENQNGTQCETSHYKVFLEQNTRINPDTRIDLITIDNIGYHEIFDLDFLCFMDCDYYSTDSETISNSYFAEHGLDNLINHYHQSDQELLFISSLHKENKPSLLKDVIPHEHTTVFKGDIPPHIDVNSLYAFMDRETFRKEVLCEL